MKNSIQFPLISLKIETVSKSFRTRQVAERVIVESLLALSLIFAIVGVESTSFAYSRFGTGFSILFSSFATFLLGSISLAIFQLLVLGIFMLTLVGVFENKFNVNRDLDPFRGPVSKIIVVSVAASIFLVGYSVSSSFPNGAASALLSVAVCALILKQNVLKIVLGLILLQCGGSIVMMLLGMLLPTVAVFNLAVTGLEFFLLNHAYNIQQMHGTLNSRRLRLTFRSDKRRRRD